MALREPPLIPPRASHSLSEKAKGLLSICERVDCMPTRIESRVVCPGQFNELCLQFGNKAAALSQISLRLVHTVLKNIPDDEPVYVLCDKHGGRNKYGPLLNEVFPETLAVVRKESL